MEVTIEEQLKAEIQKWTKKIKEERKTIKVTEENSKFMKNIDAYISDSEHFLKKGDNVRSFEAILWAWSWMEILKELNIVDKNH